MTIYLYVKQHKVTGLKYFGRTISKDPFRYRGSGIYWKRHYNKHGKDEIETLEIWGFDDQKLCSEFAIKFSKDNCIVESKLWANLIVENGERIAGKIITQEEVNNKIGETLRRKYKNKELIPSSGNKGMKMSENAKKKISVGLRKRTEAPGYIHHSTGVDPWNKGLKIGTTWNKGLKLPKQTEESNRKRSETLKKLYETKPGNRKGCKPWHAGTKGMGIQKNASKGTTLEKVKCPHCPKLGSISNMKRWHFTNCKSLVDGGSIHPN